MIWKYTLLMNFIKQIEKGGTGFEFQIPLVGKMMCTKKDGEDWTVWPLLTENIKETMTRIKNGDTSQVVRWIESELVEPVIREIEEG